MKKNTNVVQSLYLRDYQTRTPYGCLVFKWVNDATVIAAVSSVCKNSTDTFYKSKARDLAITRLETDPITVDVSECETKQQVFSKLMRVVVAASSPAQENPLQISSYARKLAKAYVRRDEEISKSTPTMKVVVRSTTINPRPVVTLQDLLASVWSKVVSVFRSRSV